MRDHGPHHGRLGTYDDCYDGSPWELHRGELVARARGTLRDRIVIPLVLTFLRTHARRYLRAAVDTYCDLTDDHGPSVRAPDVILVEDTTPSPHDFVRIVPVLAVEVRATQSKPHLDAKVALYLEHAWPLLWITHADRHELEVIQPGVAPVVYGPGHELPLPPALDKHALRSVPVDALFDDHVAEQYADGWVHQRSLAEGEARGRRSALFALLAARSITPSTATQARIHTCVDLALLDRWLTIAATTEHAPTFDEALAHP